MVWPITKEQLRSALGYKPGQDDDEELELFALAACELIDDRTGRIDDPARHLRPNGELPIIFTLAARETAKLWWQQSKNGPRAKAADPGDQSGPPMGADLPRKVQGWLEPYPAPPGIA